MNKVFANILFSLIENDSKKILEYKENNTKQRKFENFLNLKLKEMNLEGVNCFKGNLLTKFISKSTQSNGSTFDKKIDLILSFKEDKNIEIDIKEISAVAASKSLSWGYSFTDIYNFGKSIYFADWHKSNEVRDKEWDFNNSIAHVKRETNGRNFDLSHYSWNKRFLWINSGSSHHFATAVFHAFNQNIEHKIKANIKTYSIDIVHTLNLLEEYELFVFDKENLYSIKSFIDKESVEYSNKSCGNIIIIGLKKEDITFNYYINLFKKIDTKYILPLNDLLMKKIDMQKSTKNKIYS